MTLPPRPIRTIIFFISRKSSMDSIGEILRAAREQKGCSLEQIVQETNISRMYIEALEKEDFSQFPGETYVYGFLRNYADYLGLDPEKAVEKYKNFKVREQPVPIDELLGRNKRKSWKRILRIGVPASAALLVLVFLVPWLRGQWQRAAEERRIEAARQAAEREIQVYEVTRDVLENRLYEGDKLAVQVRDRKYMVELDRITDSLLLKWPGGELEAGLGEEHYIDINDDEVLDLRLALRDIDAEGGGVLLMSHLMDQDLAGSAGTDAGEEPASVTGELSEGVVILEDDKPRPFRLDAVFRGYSLLRYSADGRELEQEYFQENDRFRLEVNRQVRLGMSNAGNVIVKIGGRELDLGREGKVAVKLIRWEEDEEADQYQLKAREVY